MRILYVAHRTPYPPNKGDKIRSFNQLHHLGQRHEVYLACLADDPADLAHRAALEAFCRSVEVVRLDRRLAKVRSLCYLPTGRPLTLPYFYVPALARAVRRLCRDHDFDLAYAFSSSMAQYIVNVPGVARVLDMVDVDSDKWRQYSLYTNGLRAGLYKLEWKRMQAYERSVTGQVDRTLVIAPAETQILKRLNPDAAVSEVPNGIDEAWFAAQGPWPVTPELLAAQPYVVFTGAMDYFANVDGVTFFAREVWPRVRRQVPALRFYIVGMNPAPAVRALGARDSSIVVTGFVPDTRPYLSHAAACIVPLRIARGVQNKVLEAMAVGVPVVATPPALEGLAVADGREVLCGHDPAALAEALVRAVQRPQDSRERVERARRLVKTQYAWPAILDRLEALLGLEHERFRQRQNGAPAGAAAPPLPSR